MDDWVEGYADLGWWVVSGETLMVMLEAVQAGAEPWEVYAEHYANCDHQYVEGS